MADNAVGDRALYWAYVSYSHKDAAFARRLHRALESYVLPRRVAGRTTPWGAVPRRLVPIFRDRDEFPAANDLSAEVRAALQASRSLVVVCSPDAAASKWVAREVDSFRALHPERPILAAVRNGEPATCFPKPLQRIDSAGEPIEPLAADFRSGHDGWQLGRLKLVAGIVGIGLDELVQRNAQRNSRRVMAVTAAAFAAVLSMGALTIVARNARTEAERERGKAEGLVEFMLTDLRDKLKGVGRLDIMSAVNQRALRYYTDGEIDGLSADSLERRARILHAMGEDDETRGDHEAALKKFREALRTTAALLAADPDDPDRIFAHSQSAYWIGYANYAHHRMDAANQAFQLYKQLTDRLIARAPYVTAYWKEASYAEGNLCSLALARPSDPQAALRHCKSALTKMEAADLRSDARRRSADENRQFANDLINRHAWLADAYLANGDIPHASAERLTEEKTLDGLIAADPKNMDLKDTWVGLQLALGVLDRHAKHENNARRRLLGARKLLDDMVHFDTSNNRWSEQRAFIEKELNDGKYSVN